MNSLCCKEFTPVFTISERLYSVPDIILQNTRTRIKDQIINGASTKKLDNRNVNSYSLRCSAKLIFIFNMFLCVLLVESAEAFGWPPLAKRG